MKVRFAVSVGLGIPDPGGLAEVAAAAERHGFDTIWVSDLPSLAAVDPLLGLATAAAVTRRVHLGVNLIPFGQSPYLVAHRLAQMDRLSAGRLLVTLVPGLDLPGERAALGTGGRHRGRMMDRVVPMLREWWAGRAVTVDDGTEVSLPVLPVQSPLEVWLGGAGPEAVTRAGRLADGWLGSAVTPEEAGRLRRAIEAAAADAGRDFDPEHFGLSIGYAHREADAERAVRAGSRAGRRLAAGTDPGDLVPVGADRLRSLVGRLVDQGLSKFVLRPVAPAGDWDGELEWLAATVLDLQT